MSSKILKGKVVSTKMQKTCVVEVGTAKKHKKYNKRYTSHKRYKVHNDKFDVKVGDEVYIKEVAPISKEKHFIIIKLDSDKKI